MLTAINIKELLMGRPAKKKVGRPAKAKAAAAPKKKTRKKVVKALKAKPAKAVTYKRKKKKPEVVKYQVELAERQGAVVDNFATQDFKFLLLKAAVELARQTNIRHITMGDISIAFDTSMGLPATVDLPKTTAAHVGTPASPDTLGTEESTDQDQQVFTPEDRELFRKNMLLTTDPLQFEKEIIAAMEGNDVNEDGYTGVEPVI